MMESRDRTRRSVPLLRGTTSTVLVLVVVLTIVGQGAAFSANGSRTESRVISDEWVLSIGSLITDFNTTAAAGDGGVFGTVIRLEDELELDESQSTFRTDGLYRFNSRHAIGFGYYGLDRDGRSGINEQIMFDGNTFDVGVVLESTFDVSWFRVDWRYSFLRTDRGEAGFNLGIGAYDFKIALAGDATLGAMMTQFARAEANIAAPIPTFGLFVNFAITPNVLFRSTINFLDLDIGDIEGKVSDTSFLFEWYFTEHFGIGGGVTGTDIDYKNNSTPVSIEYSQAGFLAYFTFAFGDID